MEVKKFLRVGMAAAVVACGLSVSSCCSDNGELTKGDVEDEIEKVAAGELDHMQYIGLKTGYYEENDADARYKLRQLASLGLITYQAEDIVETTEKKDWYGRVTGHNKNHHVFVKVALTEDGQKYVVNAEQRKKVRDEIKEALQDDDIVNPNEDKEWPEDTVKLAEKIKVTDDTPIEGMDVPAQITETVTAVSVDNADTDEYDKAFDGNFPSSLTATTAYEKAWANVSYTRVALKSHKYEISKVRNIKCTQSMLESGLGEADVIFKVVDVTPFGRILGNLEDGKKFDKTYNFVKYTDGWKIND